MALPANPNQSFFREVDEELRRDQIGGLGKRYGRIVLALAALIIAAVAGYLYWNSRETKAAEAQGEVLDAAITELGANNEKAAAPKIARLAKSDAEGYRAAALLTQADIALAQGNDKAAAAAFARIVADAQLPRPFRDLALVRQTAVEFDTIAPALVIQRLRPLAVAGNPWHGSAGEMVAAAYLKQGKPALAGPIFAAVAKDEKVPESIRARVVQMAGSLGLDAIGEARPGTRN